MTNLDPFNLKPLGDRLVLHKCENEDPEGLILPEKSKDNTTFCQVVAVGPKCKFPWSEGSLVRVIEDFVDGLNEVPGTDGEFWLARESVLDPAEYAA